MIKLPFAENYHISYNIYEADTLTEASEADVFFV